MYTRRLAHDLIDELPDEALAEFLLAGIPAARRALKLPPDPADQPAGNGLRLVEGGKPSA